MNASMNGYQRDTCLENIEIHAQNLIIINWSIVNILVCGVVGWWGGGSMNDNLMRTKTFTLIINKLLIRASITCEESVYNLNLYLLTILYLLHALWGNQWK